MIKFPRSSLSWFAVVCCAATSALGIAGSAEAGTYVIRNCNVPGAARASIGAWLWDPSGVGGTFGHDECASGGGFGINAGTMPWGYSTGVSLETPPPIAIRRIRLWLVVKLRSTGSPLFSVVTSGNATTQSPVDLFGPPGGSTLATPYVSPLLPADTHIYFVLINCAGGSGAPCTAVDTDVLDVRGVETTLEENTAPTGSISGGELMTDGAQSGVRTLAYSARDAESGVARITALAGSTVVGTQDLTGDCAYAAPAACQQVRPPTTIAVDTRKVPDGIYPVSLRVTDAAGNEQTVQASTAIRVVNGAASTAGQQAASQSPGAARLSVSFAANRRSTVTVGYGRRVKIRGSLQAAEGRPIQGRIDVEEGPASGPATTTVIDTGADGTFTHTVAPGATRTLTLTYRGGSAVSKQLRLRVKASATLRVRLNGIVVRYNGTVRSKPLPRNGKLVEIQGRSPGSAWKTFAQRRTNRRGDFSGTYRLRVRRPGVRLQFRVRIPSQRGYPYVAHTGAAISRRVR